MAEDQDKQDTINAAEAIIGRTREMLSIDGRIIPIARRLAELGFNACSIRRVGFRPDVPDPDLQTEAILEISSPHTDKKSIQEGTRLLAQDYAMYTTMRFGQGTEFRLDDNRFGEKDRWIIYPKEGTPFDFARVVEGSNDIRIVLPVTSFYEDEAAQSIHRNMIDKLEEYHSERLASTLPLVKIPNTPASPEVK